LQKRVRGGHADEREAVIVTEKLTERKSQAGAPVATDVAFG